MSEPVDASVTETRSGARQRCVLVVDDSAVIRLGMAKTLQRLGCRVLQASGGSEALDIVAQQRPDLIILDVHMPGMSGIEVLERLRSDTRHDSVPVVMLTGSASEETIQQLSSMQVNGFLPKSSVSPDELNARLTRILEDPRAQVGAHEPGGGDGSEHILDHAVLLERTDGDADALQHILELYFRDYPRCLSAGRDALARGALQDLGAAAHELKGMLASLAAGPAAQAAHRVEELALGHDLASAAGAFEQMEREVDRLVEPLAALRRVQGA